ncbi:hypothetical protein CHU98_g555, partial [Xylaria longipes]
MNQTSRTDEPLEGDGLNQSPDAFSNDLVTNQDMNGIANARGRRGRSSRSMDNSGQPIARNIPVSLSEDDDNNNSPCKGLAGGDASRLGRRRSQPRCTAA